LSLERGGIWPPGLCFESRGLRTSGLVVLFL
jgi:hypothetical protein